MQTLWQTVTTDHILIDCPAHDKNHKDIFLELTNQNKACSVKEMLDLKTSEKTTNLVLKILKSAGANI